MFRRWLTRRGPGLLGPPRQPAETAPAVSTSPTTPALTDLTGTQVAQLEHLARLGARGILTEAEVAAARAKILAVAKRLR
jgi:hypothetical protein